MNHIKNLIFFLFFINSSFLTAQNINFEDVYIAIVDFEGAGFKSNENKIITDKFRNESVDKSNYRIMERIAMDEILKEQGFQQTGACNSKSCFIEAGQLLGVNYLIAGSISKTNSIFALSIRLIEIRTGEIICVFSYESQKDFLNLLSNDIPIIAEKFVKKTEITLQDISKKKQKGLLFVESTPRNGKVFIDGEPTYKLTPVTFSEMNASFHEILVKSRELISKDTVQIIAGKLHKVNMNLTKGFGNLRIRTSPENVDVTIRGLGNYKAPFQVDSMEAGDYLITAEVNGYKPFNEQLFINAGETAEKFIELKSIGYVKIHKIQENISAFFDEKLIDIKGRNLIKTVPGKHNIKIQKKGYKEFSKDFMVKEHDTADVVLLYVPIPSKLFLNSYPDGASVSVNGNKIGMTPLKGKTVTPGKCKILFDLKRYKKVGKELLLEPGRNYVFNDTFTVFSDNYLKWEKDLKRFKKFNLFFAGSGELFMERGYKGISFLSLGFISDVFIGISAYKLYSHNWKSEETPHPIEKKYFNDRKKKDTAWLVSSILSSTFLRVFSYVITSKKQY